MKARPIFMNNNYRFIQVMKYQRSPMNFERSTKVPIDPFYFLSQPKRYIYHPQFPETRNEFPLIPKGANPIKVSSTFELESLSSS